MQDGPRHQAAQCPDSLRNHSLGSRRRLRHCNDDAPGPFHQTGNLSFFVGNCKYVSALKRAANTINRSLSLGSNTTSSKINRVGGGGGSRTRVRNRSQPRDSMRSLFSKFAPRAQNRQETRKASPMILSPPHGPSGDNQPAVRRPLSAHRQR